MTVPMLRAMLRLEAADRGGREGLAQRRADAWRQTHPTVRAALRRGKYVSTFVVERETWAVLVTAHGRAALAGAKAMRRIKAGVR